MLCCAEILFRKLTDIQFKLRLQRCTSDLLQYLQKSTD